MCMTRLNQLDLTEPVMAKAQRYRRLNEPEAAESTCLDVLEIDPENQPALVMGGGAFVDRRRRRWRPVLL